MTARPAVRQFNTGARLCVALGVWAAFLFAMPSVQAETQTVIDPTVTQPAEPAAKPAPAQQSDAAIKRERARAAAEQKKREKAEARALAAEKEAERLRAATEAREQKQAELAAKQAAKQAAIETARKDAAKAAAVKAAAARAAAARLAEKQAAANSAAVQAAVARANAAKQTEIRLAAAKEEAAKELAARQVAEREAAERAAAREAAAKEAAAIAARDAAAKEAAQKAAERLTQRPGNVFRDCPLCPEMVWLPRGEFEMGDDSQADGPPHRVQINYPLAVGRFELTFAEWDACVAANGCRRRPDDAGWGRGRQPVINVSWVDSQQYVAWLSAKTGRRYRLLSEAEWEYAARAGAQTRYWWGDEPGRNHENCHNCGSRWDGRRTAPVGSFAPNAFGLYDVLGNVSEWVEDCYHASYRDAPNDGSAWTQNCSQDAPRGARDERVMRGGAWQYPAQFTSSTFRTRFSNGYYDFRIGLRVARTE